MDDKPVTHSARIGFIDAARGAAMFFVFLSHFGDAYFQSDPDAAWVTEHVGMIASPTFMTISGLLLGVVYHTSPSFQQFQQKLFDRALFLLVMGHLLTGLALLPPNGFRGFAGVYMTDVIGLCFLVGPYVVTQVRPRHRLVVSAALYGASWALALLWQPRAQWLVIAKEIFVGSCEDYSLVYVFPVIPWISVYLAATCFGERLGVRYRNGSQEQIGRLLLCAIFGSFLFVAVIKACYKLLIAAEILSRDARFYALTAPFQKMPPSPVYLAFYGGLGLAMMLILFYWQGVKLMHPLLAGISLLGRTSLFAFLLQFYIYYGLLWPFRPYLRGPWVLYFILSILIIWWTCWSWEKRGGTRYFTFGLYKIGRAKPGCGPVPRVP